MNSLECLGLAGCAEVSVVGQWLCCDTMCTRDGTVVIVILSIRGGFFFNHVFKRIIICTILDACHHAIPWHFSYFLDNNKPFLLDMTFSITILDNHWSDLSDLSLSSRFVAPGANKLSLAESESLGIWGSGDDSLPLAFPRMEHHQRIFHVNHFF